MDRLDALRYYLDIAEHGNFSSVARQRSVATSTVALAVTQLEQEFGNRLMTRTTRQLTLTYEGEKLLLDARRIISEWDAAMSGLQEGSELTGPIRVAATNDFGRTSLRPCLDEFQALHPKVQISLVLSDNSVDLLEERIDIALRYGPLADSTIRARLLIRGYRHVCASPSYWDKAGRPEHPSDLSEHNCLILARPGAPIAAWPFRDESKHFSVKVSGDRQASDGGLIREWAVTGVGVCLKNACDIRKELESGELETVLDEFIAGQVDLYAVQPAGASSRRVTALADHLSSKIPRLA